MASRTLRLTQPVKWHGGKHYLAGQIVELMPPHLHFVEPYFGGGSVLLARDPNKDWLGEGQPSHLRGGSEVVNDLNGELTNLWRVLQDPHQFEAFQRRVEAVPFSQVEWREAPAATGSTDPVQRAVAFFVRVRQSRQGIGKDFATLSRNRTRRRMNEQASAWLTVVEGLPDIHRRLRGVVILCDDACKVIRQQDGPLTHFYCDPPYLGPHRSGNGEYGEFEMTSEQHQELLETLSGIRGTFQLSGYHNELYDTFADRHGWRAAEIQIDNKASGAKVKEKKTECLWMNYPS